MHRLVTLSDVHIIPVGTKHLVRHRLVDDFVHPVLSPSAKPVLVLVS